MKIPVWLKKKKRRRAIFRKIMQSNLLILALSSLSATMKILHGNKNATVQDRKIKSITEMHGEIIVPLSSFDVATQNKIKEGITIDEHREQTDSQKTVAPRKARAVGSGALDSAGGCVCTPGRKVAEPYAQSGGQTIMKVKIGEKIYDTENEPVMIILNDKDKQNIANMHPNADSYCGYPDTLSEQEVERFMMFDRSGDNAKPKDQ
jgi:hypothetical protein